MSPRRTALSVAALVALVLPQDPCLGGAALQVLDFDAYGISADGTVVVGVGHGPSPSSAYRWSRTEGTTVLGRLPADGGAFAWGASADGSVVTGYGSDADGFRWTASRSMRAFAPDLGQPFWARGVSHDGKTIVGAVLSDGDAVAAAVTPQDTLLVLGDLPDGKAEAQAFGVSADGKVVVGCGASADSTRNGFVGTEAFRWTSGEGMVGLGSLPGGKYDSAACAVSSDGRVVVGAGDAANGLSEAFRWTAEQGMVGLGWLTANGLSGSMAFDLSADGSVIVGGSQKNYGYEAFIWDAQHGMRSLSDLLTQEYGLDLNGLTLMEARGVSDDGRTIVGIGLGQDGASQGWVVRIPEPATGMLLVWGVWFLRKRSRA